MTTDAQHRLLRAMAEELKLPLVQLASSSEQQGNASDNLTARMALKLIDGYLLGLPTEDQVELQLESLTLSSVMAEVAHELTPVAKQYNHSIQLDVAGRFGPVMANRLVLQSALVIAGNELLCSPREEGGQSTLTLATYKSRGGVRIGLFSDNVIIKTDTLRRAKALMGSARQSLPTGLHTSGAGLFVADQLLKTVDSSLCASHRRNTSGLSAQFLFSQQLQLL